MKNNKIVNDKRHGGSRVVSKKACKTGKCPSCGAWRYITPGEMDRAAAPKCQKCGAVLEWSAAEKRKAKKKASKSARRTYGENHCVTCGKKLSMYNSNEECYVCQRKVEGKDHD